jgi:methionine-rich copper-binding protein CopC
MPISIAIVLLILAAGLASAGLAVGGANLEKSIAPGEHLSHVIKVATSASDTPMDIHAEVFGYGQSLQGLNTEQNASLDKSPYTARPFLKVSPSSFHLDPGKSQEVTLEGDIPKDVGSGGRYALVGVRTLPIGNGSVGFVLNIEVPIMLTINGSEIQNKGEIESLSIEEPISADKQQMSLTFKNIGNHHYNANVTAVVKDKDGQVVANASTPLVRPILPTYSRQVKLEITPNAPLKQGTYTADATVSLADGTVLTTKETSFQVKS